MWWRGIFNDTSFVLLALLTIANGLTNGFVAWFNNLSQFPVSPIIALTLFTIVFLHITDRSTQNSLQIPCLILVFFLIIPSSLASWAGLIIATISYRLHTDKFKCEVVLLSLLALSFILKNCLLKVFSGFILHAETWLIGQFLSPFFPEIYTYKNHLLLSESHNLSIGLGCSVFSNYSFALLGWVSISYLLGHTSINITWAFNILLILIFTNIIRIGLMSIDYQFYIFMHEGVGAHIYNTLLILISASPLFLSFRRNGDKRCDIE